MRLELSSVNFLKPPMMACVQLTSAMASSICGKLQFTLLWTFSRFGRGALQPLFRRAAWQGEEAPYEVRRGTRASTDDEEGLTEGEKSALRFFVSALPEMEPHVYRIDGTQTPRTLVWSDARWEEDDPEPAAVGFLVAAPRASASAERLVDDPMRELREHYDLYHASEIISDDFMRGFMRRDQQIGQLELLALLVPYLSLPEVFADADVLHWVDNSSAVAAAAKGYSGVPDSVRIVHALHATLEGLGARVWFEYVRSEANVADLPSRVDMSDMIFDLADQFKDESLRGLRSEPVPCVLPEERDWADGAARWTRSAKEGRSKGCRL